jgi:hypothetical protein
MNKGLMTLVLLAASFGNVAAQNDETYQQFRQKMMSDYSDYRGQILQDYAKFLDTVWKDFDTFSARSLYPHSKPKTAPKAPVIDGTPVASIPQPGKPTPQPEPSAPIQIKPKVPNPLQAKINFRFYTANVQAPKLTVKRLESTRANDVSRLWKEYQNADLADKVLPSLNQLRIAYHLNDWLTYVLVRNYSDAVYPNDINSSIVLSHYLLVNMGMNLRIACVGGSRMAHLIPIKQTVYGHPFLNIDGIRYYVFLGGIGRENIGKISSISTCELPQNTNLGKSFSLVLNNPQIPSQDENAFSRTDGHITITGSVPSAAIVIARDYVETDVRVYASSCLSPTFCKNILQQIAPQLAGLSESEAVNKLLHFIQFAFKYETDGEQFGYEKPYFVEENFYYPTNDCEDRAVLLAFLVRNLLHLDVHLLYYPNHEATAIRFSDQSIKGDGYIYQDNSKYLICDPTYIGAKAGQCMPQYEGVKPTVELW